MTLLTEKHSTDSYGKRDLKISCLTEIIFREYDMRKHAPRRKSFVNCEIAKIEIIPFDTLLQVRTVAVSNKEYTLVVEIKYEKYNIIDCLAS